MSFPRSPSRFRRSCVAALIVLGTGAWAQPAVNAPSARPAPRPGLTPAPMVPVDAAATVSLKGTVSRWLTNPNGEVDGLLLADGTQVGFPPHLSAQVTSAVKLKDAVNLTGWQDGAVFRAASIRATASGRSVRDDGPPSQLPAPKDPAALTEMAASGRIDTLLRGPRGEVNGVVLQSGEQVRFPPHVGVQYASLLQQGAMLSARGYGTRNAYGTAFEATALGENGTSMRQVFVAPRPPAGDGPSAPVGPAVRPAS